MCDKILILPRRLAGWDSKGGHHNYRLWDGLNAPVSRVSISVRKMRGKAAAGNVEGPGGPHAADASCNITRNA